MAKTIVVAHHSDALQAVGGYRKGELILHDGVVWESMINHNMTPPGDHHHWEMHSIEKAGQ